MNKVFYAAALLFLFGCSPREHSRELKAKVIELEKIAADLKPGLGDIMSVIQQHHAKLYYSGVKENWALARYQLDEIQEGLADAVRYYPKFKEVKASLVDLVPAMTKASVELVDRAITKKNKKEFLKAFNALSVSCTNCHQAAEHPFIKIQFPSEGMFSNQKFEP